jgi:broad specificity phosphatase PhoE
VLVSSDLVRATETADAIAGALGLAYHQKVEWRERSFGPFEGRTIGEADVWRAATGHWDLPGAEPTVAFQSRVQAALAGLVATFPAASCVGVVTHGAVLRNTLQLLADGRLVLCEGEPVPASVPIANCAIMHLEARLTGEGTPTWRVRVVNDVEHLAGGTVATFRGEE